MASGLPVQTFPAVQPEEVSDHLALHLSDDEYLDPFVQVTAFHADEKSLWVEVLPPFVDVALPSEPVVFEPTP